MFNDLSPQQLLIAAGTFGLVLSAWIIAVTVGAMRRTRHDAAMARRLGEIDEKHEQVRVLRLWTKDDEATTVVPGRSRLNDLRTTLIQLPQRAGWTAPLSSVLLGWGGVAVLASVIAFAVTHRTMVLLGTNLAFVFAFVVYTQYRIAKNLARFEQQFADALQLLSRSLRAGHPLSGSFRLTAEEMQPPVSHIFERLCQEQTLGISVEESLRAVAAESSSPDVKLFATSVAIQLRTGGNLADMMDRLAAVIRSRIRLTQRVRVVSAQTQLSKRILLGLPLVMLLLLSIINPAHLAPLFATTLGHRLLVAGGALMLLGWFTMNKMAKLKY